LPSTSPDDPAALRWLTEDDAAAQWPELAADLCLHGMLYLGAWFSDREAEEPMAAPG
jgi:hypothetical protein